MFTYLQNMPRSASVTAIIPVCGGSVCSQSASRFCACCQFSGAVSNPDKPLRDTFLRRQADEMHIRAQWPNVCRLIPEDHKSKAVNAFLFKCKMRFQPAHSYRWQCNERVGNFLQGDTSRQPQQWGRRHQPALARSVCRRSRQ